MEASTQTKFNPDVEDIKKEVLEFCIIPKSKGDILHHIGVEASCYNFQKYILGLVTRRYLQPTLPRSSTSPHQQFKPTIKGLNYLKLIG